MVKIICEGGDDHSFLTLLLLNLQENKLITDKITNFGSYIQPMAGKSNLLNQEKYVTINKQINKKIKKVLFIFDCDFEEDDKKCGNFENSQECIKNLIVKLNWHIETDYFIFDKNLDYFIIDTLKEKDTFVSCEKCLDLKKLNKNRKLLSSIYKELYPKSPYDFTHDNFDELKQKLINLFKEEE